MVKLIKSKKPESKVSHEEREEIKVKWNDLIEEAGYNRRKFKASTFEQAKTTIIRDSLYTLTDELFWDTIEYGLRDDRFIQLVSNPSKLSREHDGQIGFDRVKFRQHLDENDALSYLDNRVECFANKFDIFTDKYQEDYEELVSFIKPKLADTVKSDSTKELILDEVVQTFLCIDRLIKARVPFIIWTDKCPVSIPEWHGSMCSILKNNVEATYKALGKVFLKDYCFGGSIWNIMLIEARRVLVRSYHNQSIEQHYEHFLRRWQVDSIEHYDKSAEGTFLHTLSRGNFQEYEV